MLKKLSIFCYFLGIVGIVIGIIAIINANIGNALFQSYIDEYKTISGLNMDYRIYTISSFMISCTFTLFEGWLLGRAAKNGKKTTLLIILILLGVISPIIEICRTGFNSILNVESIANIIGIMLKIFILNQVLKVRKEAQEQ